MSVFAELYVCWLNICGICFEKFALLYIFAKSVATRLYLFNV